MTITKSTLEENRVEHIILLHGNQTFTEAEKILEDLNLPEEDTYVVVELPNNQYNVIFFSDLKVKVSKKADRSTQPLSNLDIPPASRVVPTDTTESGLDILDWVDTHPQSTVVVTDAGKFVGLFTNPNRSGSLPGEPTTPPPPPPEKDI